MPSVVVTVHDGHNCCWKLLVALLTSENFSTIPLPIPYRQEDLSNEAVLQFITDSDTRNTLISSLLSLSGNVDGDCADSMSVPASAAA